MPENTENPGDSAPSAITPDEAVERCMKAYRRALNASAAKGNHQSQCRCDGGDAYRLAMPSTGSLAEVLAFIACVIRGIHLRIWRCREEMELFYAAQIAISAHQRAAGRKKNTPPPPM